MIAITVTHASLRAGSAGDAERIQLFIESPAGADISVYLTPAEAEQWIATIQRAVAR